MISARVIKKFTVRNLFKDTNFDSVQRMTSWNTTNTTDSTSYKIFNRASSLFFRHFCWLYKILNLLNIRISSINHMHLLTTMIVSCCQLLTRSFAVNRISCYAWCPLNLKHKHTLEAYFLNKNKFNDELYVKCILRKLLNVSDIIFLKFSINKSLIMHGVIHWICFQRFINQ